MDSGYLWLPVNVRLTPCQNQQACLLCRPSSVWSLNPSWQPLALLSEPTEAVWDYMCGYYPHHPPLHHTGWVVEGSSRTRSDQRRYHKQTCHSSCCTSLKSGWWWSVVSLATESKDQVKKKRWILEMEDLLGTDWKVHSTFLGYSLPGGTLEW